MATVITDDKHYKNIANAIRDALVYDITGNYDSTKQYTPSEMPKAVSDVFQCGHEGGFADGDVYGHENGFTEGVEEGYWVGFGDGWDDGYIEGESYGYGVGYDEGHAAGVMDGWEQGAKDEYDRFWDAFQNNGELGTYNYAFYNWDSEMFKPKYDIVLGTGYSGQNMFYGCSANIAEALEEQGVRLDTTNCGYLSEAFRNSKSPRIPEINCAHTADYSTNGLYYAFRDALCETIDKMIVVENTAYNSTFLNCNNLKNIVIEGVIGNNINFQWCPLTKESITSVINALSTTTTGNTATFKKTAKEAAFMQEEWDALIVTKSNWTISLV